MAQLLNTTRFAADSILLPNETAVDTLYIVIKAAFNIGKDITLADEQPPPLDADLYWTEPGCSSIKYAADLHIGKPATDVVMLGHACVPDSKNATALDVALSVGQVGKTVQVFGDRQWKDGSMTRPAPFKTMAMVYEKAYGGAHVVNGHTVDAYARNPVGCGFAGSREADDMNGMPLPNLEDPRQLIRSHTDQPMPACFAFCAPNWQPRASYAGTYDDTWQTTRAPYLPEDFDRRFFNMAHPDLIYPGYLQGGEPVTISNMHPAGTLRFDLPQVNLATRVRLAGRTESAQPLLDTVVLEPNQLRLTMVWRAAVPCDKQALKIDEVKVALSRA